MLISDQGSSELWRRLITAGILIPLVLITIFVGGIAFVVLIAVGAGLVVFEWTRMTSPGASGIAALLPGVAMLAVLVGWMSGGAQLGMALLACTVVAVALLSRTTGLHPLWAGASVIYAGIGAVAVVMLRESDGPGLAAILWLFVLVWLGDSSAFVCGKAIGGPRLAPKISPAKTWAGAIAAFVSSLLVGLVTAFVLKIHSAGTIVAISGGVGIAAILGDLVESWIKRRFGAKNAGDLFPGHGGMMDRVDSLILAGIAAWAFGCVRGGIEAPARGILQW